MTAIRVLVSTLSTTFRTDAVALRLAQLLCEEEKCTTTIIFYYAWAEKTGVIVVSCQLITRSRIIKRSNTFVVQFQKQCSIARIAAECKIRTWVLQAPREKALE